MKKGIAFLVSIAMCGCNVFANELFVQKAEEYYVQGMEAYKQGKYDESIALMDSCIHYNELDGRQWPYRSANAACWKASAYHKLGNDSIANTVYPYYMVEMYDDSLSLHADSLSYFSSKYQEEGNYEEALKYAIASNEEYKRLFGENSIDYCLSLSDVASLYFQVGNADEAIRLFEQVVALYKKNYGETFYIYSDALYQLANINKNKGEYAKAEQLYQETLQVLKKISGTENEYYVIVLASLVDLYSSTSEYSKAESIYLEIISIQKAKLGEKHPDYAADLNNLANLYLDMGDYTKAEPLYIESMKIIKEVLGENHHDYAISLNNLADLYRGMGDYLKAEPLYQESLKIKKKILGENHPSYATSLNNLAVLYCYMRKYSEAVLLYQEAIKIRKSVLGEHHYDYVQSLSNLANTYYDMTLYSEAESLYQELVIIQKVVLGDKHQDYANSLHRLASIYYINGDYTQAEYFCKEAVSLRQQILGENHPDYAQSLDGLACIYWKLGNYYKAEPLYQEALKIRKEVLDENHPDYATSLNNLASLYLDMGDYSKAEPLYQELLKIRKKVLGENHPDYAACLNSIAVLYYYMADYTKAELMCHNALKIFNDVLEERSSDYATCLENLANLYSDMGDYSKAEPLYQESLRIKKEVLGENHPAYALCLYNLATFYGDLGDYTKAEQLCLESIKIRKEVLGDKHPDYVSSISCLAHLYDYMGNYDKSELLYQEALKIYKEVFGENNIKYVRICNGLGCLYYDMGNYLKAVQIYSESIRILKYMIKDNHLVNKISLYNLNNCMLGLMAILARIKNYSQTELYLQKFMDFLRLYPDFEQHHHEFGLLYHSTGNYSKAESYIKEDYYLNRHLLEECFSFMSERQRNLFYKKYANAFNDFYPKFCYEYYDTKDSISCLAYDNELFIKGLLLNTSNSIQNSILESGDTALINKWNELRSVKERILKLQSQPLDKQAGMQELLSRAERLDKELTKASAAYRDVQAGWGVTWSDVQKKLGKNDVAVEFVDFQDTADVVYYALVLHKDDKYPRLVPLFRESETDSIMQSYGSKAAVYNYFEEDSTHLYDVVWKRLEPYIADGSTVYYSATGVLHQMNVEAIPLNDSTRIGDRYKMVRLSSTRQLVTGKQERRETKATVYGGIRYDLDSEVMEAESVKYADSTYYASRTIEFSQDSTLRAGVKYLPGTKRESDEISVILKGSMERVSLMQDSVANEESFKALSGKHYNILHIATHGFFWPIEKARGTDLFRARMSGMGDDDSQMAYRPLQDPMQRSGLILAGANLALRGGSEYIPRSVEDGILTAKEISNIDLRDADLVVLSACETGSGEVSGEGVFGLQRGFKQAGAQTIIMSLWKVDDKVTQELMEQFYRNWTSGKTKREAFNTAVTTIRTQHPEPGYWAAFIMLD